MKDNYIYIYRLMFPLTCFSCGRPIGHLWLTYMERLEDERRKLSKEVDVDYDANVKFEILTKLRIADECCRRMFICQIDNIYDLVL